MQFRRDLLGARFVSDDGMLTFVIWESTLKNRERFPLMLDVWNPAKTFNESVDRYPARWHPRKDPLAKQGRVRLDSLQAELGTAGIGATYSLMFARSSDDLKRQDGYDFVAITEFSNIAEMAVFPEHGGTPFGGDDWDWQEGWWYPYSTYRFDKTVEYKSHF